MRFGYGHQSVLAAFTFLGGHESVQMLVHTPRWDSDGGGFS